MPDRMLELSPDLELPVSAATETFLIFGKRGVGKTSTGTVLAEELIGAGQPVGVLDPKGDWWGLRSSADGQGPGLPVTILGGEHADLPLDPRSGTAVADLLASERLPVVIDMSLMSKTQQRSFVTDFMERLYRANREPLHLVIDEADRFAPQRADRDMARLLGAYEDIVLRGRKFGIGSTSITLRPAQLNAAIRSQVEVLIAMRLLGKLDVDAINEWIRVQASEEDARDLKASLPTLPTGTAWVWSPGWLEIMAKIQVRPRRTFDSSATPKVGQQLIVPRQFAPVNPADLERMAVLLGRDDQPQDSGAASAETTALRAEITRLRAEITELRSRPTERIEVPVVASGDIAALEQAVAGVRDLAAGLELALSRVGQQAVRPAPAPVQPAPAKPAPEPRTAPAETEDTPALGKAQRAILTILAQFHDGRSRAQLATLTGYSLKSSSFANALGALRSAGLVNRGPVILATAAGIDALGGDYEPLPTGEALVEHWMGQLGKAERILLRLFLDAWPQELTKTEAAERSGYSPTSSSFANALGRLRTLELIRGWQADETLAGQEHREREQAAIEAGGTGA